MTQYIHIEYPTLDRLPGEDAYREAGTAQDQARQAVGQIGAYRDALVAQMVDEQPREWGAQGEVARRLGVTPTTIGRHLKHHKERSMDTTPEDAGATTQYGDWGDWSGHDGPTSGDTLEEHVEIPLNEFTDDYDVQGIADEFREALNAQLPEGFNVRGSIFYGPYRRSGVDAGDMLADALDRVDYWSIVARHES